MGYGTGFSAIPGSSTPPSRFVRAAKMGSKAFPKDELSIDISCSVRG